MLICDFLSSYFHSFLLCWSFERVKEICLEKKSGEVKGQNTSPASFCFCFWEGEGEGLYGVADCVYAMNDHKWLIKVESNPSATKSQNHCLFF